LDVVSGGGDLDRSLKEKSCTVTGWDWEMDRIDKNTDFYKLLEELDVEKEVFEKEKYDVVVFFSMCLSTCTMLLRYCDIVGIFFKSGWKGVGVTSQFSLFREPYWTFKGDWNYTNEGILDRTHIRFYTLATARKFLTDAGVLQYEK
jgi:hypothetical protein